MLAWQDSPQEKLSVLFVILSAAVKAADTFRPMPVSIYTGLLLRIPHQFNHLGSSFPLGLPKEVTVIHIVRRPRGLSSVILKPKAKGLKSV